ncbi:hypothetical protein TNCT_457951 [Trichonephila clavata]|uniref:Uncharacterized protein n=1 Tax=Trichonephila clavata TaxID=2740835 RepID=A0A8X6HSZ8_TRICU|nr:hypothetical protein TNCT_457951 [Trichonephila clavata]
MTENMDTNEVPLTIDPIQAAILKKHYDLEANLVEASFHLKFITDTFAYEKTFSKGEELIQKYRKNFAGIDKLMEHQRGELPSF